MNGGAEQPVSVEVHYSAPLSAENRAHLERVLHNTGISVEVLVAGALQAAGEEALNQLLGKAAYPTKLDARQSLLRRLVALVFGARMPPARVVAGLFHVPTTTGASLIAATTARFYAELGDARNGAALETLRNGCSVVDNSREAGERHYRFRCGDRSLVAHMRDLLSESSTSVHPIRADTDAVATYLIHDSALEVLAAHFGVPAEELRSQQSVDRAVGWRRRRGRTTDARE